MEMKKLLTVPCFYHPTTVIIVDDNEKFLKSMSRILYGMDPHIKVKTFSNPDEAIMYVNKTKDLSVSIQPEFDLDDYLPSSGKVPAQYNISDLYKKANDTQVFNEISVAVVDYSMPNKMTGGDFCASILGTNIKRIMLTGEADAELGVALLNDRIINKFLIKGQHDMEEKLADSIIDMKRAYFEDLSTLILKSMSSDVCSCLSDPVFASLFDEICNELDISSYYLLDLSGSFLLMNDKGELSWLIVKTKKDISDYVELLQDAAVSDDLIDVIKTGEKIAYFYSEKDYLHSIDSDFPLQEYLYDAKELNGKEDYYYTVIKSVDKFPLNRGASFER
jgi:CheY-like chemotaxis protein